MYKRLHFCYCQLQPPIYPHYSEISQQNNTVTGLGALARTAKGCKFEQNKFGIQ